jgi:hypothetical protein
VTTTIAKADHAQTVVSFDILWPRMVAFGPSPSAAEAIPEGRLAFTL